jgi:uncharacterized protein YqgC (DUF456 family)
MANDTRNRVTRKSWIVAAGLSAALLALPAVASAQFTETQKGTGVGALLGAGTGAIIGVAVHHPVAGTLIGAGVGGVGGYAVGHELQNQQDANYYTRRELSAQQREIEQQRREIQQLQASQQTE